MKAEYINDNIRNRQKLLFQLVIILLLILLYNFCRYYFAPLEYQTGDKNSKYWSSYTQFIILSILTAAIIIPIIFSAKIVRKLFVDTDQNKLDIEYIDRFRLKPKSVSVKLSETAIQVEERQYRDRNFVKRGEIFYKLHLTNPAFGHIKISSLDFSDIKEISKHFQSLKDTATLKSRQSRLRRKPKR